MAFTGVKNSLESSPQPIACRSQHAVIMPSQHEVIRPNGRFKPNGFHLSSAVYHRLRQWRDQNSRLTIIRTLQDCSTSTYLPRPLSKTVQKFIIEFFKPGNGFFARVICFEAKFNLERNQQKWFQDLNLCPLKSRSSHPGQAFYSSSLI